MNDSCDVCLGKPLESGRPCICGGEGTSSSEKVGLRKKVHELELQLRDLREECAKTAESEPELEGPMPEENRRAAAQISLEDHLRETVRATKKSIARRIREGAEKRPCRCACHVGGDGAISACGCCSSQTESVGA